jgi:hypothetical protein
VTEDELREIVSRYWVIDDIRPARIHAVIPESVEQLFPAADIRNEPHGRKSMPAFLLTAHLD